MDVHCSTCNEPWDTFHLWQDAVFETGLTFEEATAWRKLPSAERLSERYRTEFRSAGWEFGKTIINVVRCPSCPREAIANPDQVHIKGALEGLFGEDEDGLAATYEDYRL